MLKLSGIAVPLDDEAACRGGVKHRSGLLVDTAASRLGIDPGQVASVRVLRRSIDARKKRAVHFVVALAVELSDASEEARLRARGVGVYKPYVPLEPAACAQPPAMPPVVVGTGPAGLFAALHLARAGVCPVVIEQGPDVDRRARDVATLNESGVLNVHSNIQFGEGGAGTFSDGKLTTNIKSPFAPHVLHTFAEAGAPDEILWQAKPHIGSDRLPAVVKRMREEVVARGGVVRFDTQLTGLAFEGGRLSAIEVTDTTTGASEKVSCSRLVLACGHSARSTFEVLQRAGVHIEQKPFAVGVRIEHPQEFVNCAQWGSAAAHPALGAADYKLAVHGCAGRSVFTFCMCPGGEVLCAASEEGGLATNGASSFARNGTFANAGVLVGVGPADFGGTDPLGGVRFQRQIEQRAYQEVAAAGGAPYQLPAQTVGSFLAGGGCADALPDTSCVRGVVACDLRRILPAFVADSLAEALPAFDRKLPGFAAVNALLVAPETRSSSPVRVARNASCEAWLEGFPREGGCGIYPAGEGAGYAGGIMSAACDGLRVATALIDPE